MLSHKFISSRSLSFLFALAFVATFGLSLRAQDVPTVHVGNTDIKGMPDDWTHHHVVYSDPGTEEDAIKSGTHEQWRKAVNDPRYVIQQLKHGLSVRGPAVQDVDSRRRIEGQEGEMWKRWGRRDPRDPREPRDPKLPPADAATLDRDWSVGAGLGNGAASITLTAIAPTVGNPASGSSTLALSAGGAATMTASAPTIQAGTITFGGAAPGGGTSFTSIGGMRYNFVNTTGFGTPGAGICTVYNGGGFGGNRTTTETNLLGAMGAGGGSNSTWLCGSRAGQLFNVTGSSNGGFGGHTIDVAANLAGATGYGVPNVGTSGFSYADSTTASDGTSDGTHFTYWSGNTFDTAAQFATSLESSVNASGVNGNVTATTNGASLIITADAAGTAGNLYTANSNFTHLTGSGTFSGGVNTAVQPNTFPAKYSFSTGTISASNCTSDYVVFPTGLAGSSAQATIVAYNDIYKTTCSTGSVPNTYWAYNTGGTTGLSPTLSYYGDQVAYIQTVGTTASLVLLKWGTTGGTVGAPVTPTLAASAAAYHTCTTPCYFAIPLSGSPNDTNSSPYYDYGSSDIMYVGDNSGKLHKFTGVFNGAPAEAGSPWPITVSAKVLTSPVLDSVSGNIFVADSGGYLYSYNASTAAHVLTTSQLAVSTGGAAGIVDSPVIDSSLESVYVFVGNDENTSGSLGCDVTSGCVGIYQFPATASGTGSGVCTPSSATSWGGTTLCGVEAVSGTANTADPAYYDGAFDNTYLSSVNGTGHMWGCAPHVGAVPRLESTTITANAIVPTGDVYSAGNTTNGPILTGTTVSSCSPVTEVYGSNGTTNDYIFASVPTGGNLAGCSGACIYNFVVSGTTATLTAGLPASGGTSGITIDNLSPVSGGGSEVYFLTLGSQTCTTSSTTGWCATQATQPALQ